MSDICVGKIGVWGCEGCVTRDICVASCCDAAGNVTCDNCMNASCDVPCCKARPGDAEILALVSACGNGDLVHIDGRRSDETYRAAAEASTGLPNFTRTAFNIFARPP